MLYRKSIFYFHDKLKYMKMLVRKINEKQSKVHS